MTKREPDHSCLSEHLKKGHAVLSALSEILPSHQQKNLYKFLDQDQLFKSRKKEERKTAKEKAVEEYSYVNDQEILLAGKSLVT